MTELSLVIAVCEDCGRGHRVPSSSRTYTCTHCGGAVHFDVASATRALGIPCQQCGAENPVGLDRCEECAHPLTPAGSARTAGPGNAAGHDRAAAARERQRLRKAGDTLQLAYRAGGVVAFLFALLCASCWYRFGSRGWGSLSAISAIGTIAYTVEATLMLLGSSLSRRAPLAMALVLATVSTALTAAMGQQLAGSGASKLLIGIAAGRVVFSLGLWCLVPWAMRLGRLREEHPDLDRARVPGGTRHRILAGDGMAFVSERRWRRDERTRVRARWTSAAVAAVLIAGSAAFWFATRPPSADELIERFEAAWASRDVDSVAELFGDEAQVRARQLRAWLTREELEALPGIDSSSREALGARHIRFTCNVELGQLELGCVHQGERWILNRMVFPPAAQARAQRSSRAPMDRGSVDPRRGEH